MNNNTQQLAMMKVVDNMKGVQGVQREKTVEVGDYIYEEDQGHEVFKNVLREAFSFLNFSLGDVAHAVLCSRLNGSECATTLSLPT